MSGKVAFCTVPHIGGIYSVYQRMRRACAEHGWDVRCVYPASEIPLWNGFDRGLADEGVVELGAATDDALESARRFVDWVRSEDVSVVVPMSMRACLSSVPHLPSAVRVVTRCINVTPHAYRLVAQFPSRTDAVVVTSPRQQSDLARGWGVSPDRMRLIPNAVDLERFHPPRSRDSDQHGPLRIGVVDRLEDLQKSVFLIPKILSELDARGVSWTIDVVGAGPDEAAFRARLGRLARPEAVRFHGPSPLGEVAERLRAVDVLLKPSKNEGFPSSVIEAMACGAAPVVSRIAGVTDWIVRDGETGRLCPIDDIRAFADALTDLAKDRPRLRAISGRAAAEASKRFDMPTFGAAWSDLFEDITARPKHPEPLGLESFEIAAPFRPRTGFRRIYGILPRHFKERIRSSLENKRARREW